VDDIAPYLTDPRIAMMLESAMACAFVGAPATVKAGLEAFVARHQPDELMVTCNIFDSVARKTSYTLLAELWGTAISA
jgi:alkanesulfonate monooxygenase SsuD/methylene tetrahydromethanopterin reductase-like flavin-dependent oxidoreductase (luciferase family)